MKEAEVVLRGTVLLFPPQCDIEGNPDPSLPTNFGVAGFNFVKFGLADAGYGGAAAWEVKNDKEVTKAKCIRENLGA